MATRINADYNHDGRISEQEWDNATSELSRTDDRTQYQVEVGGRVYTGTLSQLERQLRSSGILSNAAEPQSPTENSDAQLAALQGEMDELLQQIMEAKETGNTQRLAELQGKMQQLLARAQRLSAQSNRPIDLAPYREAARSGSILDEANAQTNGGSTRSGSQPSNAGSAKANTRSAGRPAGAQAQPFLPSSWKGHNSGSDITSPAYAAAQGFIEGAKADAFDAVNESTKRGKQLMMLFFYFARMAESGDLGAMYQFMKFITYIITKDKARQQIEMGKKLITLQEVSRQWTDKLMKLTLDPNDPNSALKMNQLATEVKAQTDTIALSQKLIGQTMEEFAQVTEVLTGVTKNLLDADGRVKRMVVRG